MGKREGILLISKPICPPWNDSGKNLIRDLVNNLKDNPKYRFRILTSRQSNFIIPDVITEKIFSTAGRLKPSLFQNLRVLLRLLKPDPDIKIYHFFFAPNPLSCFASKFILGLKRKKSIQTILSSPKSYENINRLIFADKVVVLSDYNRKKLAEKGIMNVVRIYPGIEIEVNNKRDIKEEQLRQKLGLAGKKVVLYAGDYEHGDAPIFIKESIPEILKRIPHLKFIFACRLKTPGAYLQERRVKLEIERAGLSNYVVFLNEVDDIPTLIRICDLSILPVNSLYAKMDIPLILLESLREAKPIVVSDVASLKEILKDEAGICIRFGNPQALAEAIIKILSDEKLKEKMGEKARSILEEYFDIKKIAREYDRIYSELLN